MNTRKMIAKEFEELCSNQKKEIKRLRMEIESLEQMLQSQQMLITQKEAIISELESELSTKENLLKIKEAINANESLDRKERFKEICENFEDCMAEYGKHGVIRFLAELTQKLHDNGVDYTVELFDGELSVNEIRVHSEETENPLCENVPNYEAMYKKLYEEHQSDCIRITELHTALDVIMRKYEKLREIHGL